MTAMHPDSGVPWTDARNSIPSDVELSQNCSELWYSTSRCAPRFDPAAANAVLAELVNVINGAQVTYDCSSLTQVLLAINYLIQRGLPRCAMLSGGGNTYVATLNPPMTAYNCCMALSFVPPDTNTDAVTLNIDGRGITPLLRNDALPLKGGDFTANAPFQAIYCNGAWYMTGLVKSQAAVAFDLLIAIFDATATWTVPAGVTSICIEAWGSGGGGGAGDGTYGGGGGGGGEYGLLYTQVTPGEVISMVIGKGGLGASVIGQAGQWGGDTIVTIPGIGQAMLMKGGGGGLAYVPGADGSSPGQGGTIVGSGEIIYGSGGFIPSATWLGTGSPGGGTARGRLYAMPGNSGLPPGGGGAGNNLANTYTLVGITGADGRVKITYPRTGTVLTALKNQLSNQ